MNRILLIDDDLNLGKVISYQLRQEGYEIDVVQSGEKGLKLLGRQNYDAIISDLQMPGISGIEVLNQVRKKNRQVVFIIITAYGTVDNAIEACRLGADDYIAKPFGKEQLLFTLEKNLRFRQIENDNIRLQQEVENKFNIENMIAVSGGMQKLLKLTRQVASTESTALILGETGTGKEMIARAIHYNSSRKESPLVTVNCPAIPDSLLESELFGHVRGAFTGAEKNRVGKFEKAHGGAIFLDEIGDLSVGLQAKLLRVLQEGEFDKLGGESPIKVDVRIIAATNQNLESLVKEKKFRADLFYRLSVIPIIIPPLRERVEDIRPLMDFFIKRYGSKRQYHPQKKLISAMKRYPWPGNVRELENTVQRLVTLANGERLTLEDLPTMFHNIHKPEMEFDIVIPEDGVSLQKVEIELIRRLLKRTGGNQSQTARLLHIPRHVLLYRIKKYNIE